jgi:flavin reductase (DIM6/NTAB) family NADH-FMN oxidoreductase RutF
VLACEVVQTLDVGTHMIFVGEVKDAEVLSDATPMTYAYYHSTLKGKTPPKASSYVKE